MSVDKKEIMDKLKEVIDPELGIDIVELGLIYNVEMFKGNKAKVEMTFTTPACPMINFILANVESKLNELKGIDIEVKVVFDPPWSPEKMSKEAKLKLGMI